MDAISTAAEADGSTDDHFEAGDPCLAVSELDGEWYRAVVVEQKADQRKCHFVDYG